MIQKDLGFVLKRYNFRETSLITTLYTHKFGKIKGILKGFYTSKKEFTSPLDLFSLNEFVFYPKKSEIWLVSFADLISDYPFLRKDLSKAKASALLSQVIDRTMQLWDSNHYIFNLTRDCLEYLHKENASKIIYIFLIKFLTFSGFKPEFNHCIVCRGLLGCDMLFNTSKGGLICKNCQEKIDEVQRISQETAQSLLYIQKEDLPLACRLNPSAKCQKEMLDILHQFLSYHLDFYTLADFKVS